MTLPKANCIHLIRTINDAGKRLDVEPTVKRITVDGIKYVRSTTARIEYPDGKIGMSYFADVPIADFLDKSKAHTPKEDT